MEDFSALRRNTASTILKKYWPNHHPIWINGVEDYKMINYLLSLKENKDVVICQTEEDWFYHFHPRSIRERIATDKNWTENSFLITNSRRDYEYSKNFIKAKFAPGILDLISYRPYNKTLIDINADSIKFHTAMLYDYPRKGRVAVANVLKEFSDKIAILKTPNDLIINLDDDDDFIFLQKQDAPNVDIEQDYYIKNCAFTVAFETFNGLPNDVCETTEYFTFSPTLSEKTYKSMHFLRPSLVFGGYKTRDYLRHFGFDTWDWLINWTFDNEPDPNKRLFLYVQELKRLLSLDVEVIKQLIETNKDSLYKNRDRIFYIIDNYGKDLF